MPKLISPTGSQVNVPEGMLDHLMSIGWVKDNGTGQREEPPKRGRRKTSKAAEAKTEKSTDNEDGTDAGDVRDSD